MNSNTLNEIQTLNLSYLVLAQRTLGEDKIAGMARFGMSEQVADALLKLSVEQMSRLSRSPQLLLRFRFDDRSVLSALVDKVQGLPEPGEAPRGKGSVEKNSV
jgi:flagellar transcriptional activator FlhD